MCEQVVEFLNNSVFPIEPHFARQHFMDVMAFDAWTNTKLEGTNCGYKYSELGVKPNMSVAEATKRLSLQDNERNKRKGEKAHRSLSNHKLRTDSLTANSICKEADGELMQQFDLRHRFISFISPDRRSWYVLFLCSEEVWNLIPHFERVRIVSIVDDGKLDCTCLYSRRFGLGCRHMAHVLEYYTEGFQGFLPDDVDLRYHDIYCRYVAYRDQEQESELEKEITQKLMDLRRRLPTQLPKAREVVEGIDSAKGKEVEFEGSIPEHIRHVQSIAPRVTNYTAEQVMRALQNHQLGSSFYEVGWQTQEETEDPFFGTGNYDDVTEDSPSDSGNYHAFDSMSFGEPSPEKRKQSNLYDELQPLLKELYHVYDGASPEAHKDVMETIESLVLERKKKRALDFNSEGPKGKRVSAMLPAKNVSSKHKRQSR
jgi:hypothetical protein